MNSILDLPARNRLFVLGAAVLALQVLVFTPVAIGINLPTQFGSVGTDAGEEFLSRGTAISAPLPPLVVLGLSLLLLRRPGRLGAVGAVGVGLMGTLFFIGALGEAFADPTRDVSKAVLVGSGLVVGALGASMSGLAVAAVAEHRGLRNSISRT